MTGGRSAYRLAWVTILAALLLVAWLVSGLVYPRRIYAEYGLDILTPRVASGVPVRIMLHNRKAIPATAITSIAIANGVFRPLPLFVTGMGTGANTRLLSLSTEGLPPGRYRVEAATVVESSALRREFYQASGDVEVLP